MSYAVKYRVNSVPSKDGDSFKFEMLEDGYVGDVIELMPDANPFLLRLIPSTDDPFSPIVSSELHVALDITDLDTDDIPDFQSVDDRRYFVKLYDSDDNVVWKGFTLNDNVSVTFNTGVQSLEFDCTDGLAILQNVDYVPTQSDITLEQSLLESIIFCLNQLEYPDDFNLKVALRVFAEGMDDLTEPLAQSYAYNFNWVNDDLTFVNCYEVLRRIMLSFGCRLIQSGGGFTVQGINQSANTTYTYVVYDSNGDQISVNSDLIGYEIGLPTTDHYFTGGNQRKLLLKGFGRIETKHTFEYAPHNIGNPNWKLVVDNIDNLPLYWTLATTAGSSFQSGALTEPPYLQFSSGTVGVARASATARAKNDFAWQDDTLSIGFQYQTNVTDTSRTAIWIRIRLYNNSGSWTLNADGQWQNDTTGRYEVKGTESLWGSVNVTTDPFPIGDLSDPGEIEIELYVEYDGVTQITVLVRTVTVQIRTQKKYISYMSNRSGKEYLKTVEIPMGHNFNGYTSLKGILTPDPGDTSLTNWYRYEDNATVYTSLTELMQRQYAVIFGRPSVNLEGTWKGQTKVLDENVRVYDAGGIFNVDANYYVLGYCTINFVEAEIQGTLLQISNENITQTVTSFLSTTN